MKILYRPLAIILIKYLQRYYRIVSEKNRYNQTNQVMSKLILVQSILYFFKSQFSAWGYFHPSCVWTDQDDKEFKKLFPEKGDFYELPIVVWYNPAAVTHYHNRIYKLQNNKPSDYQTEIKNQLKKWGDWN